MQMIRGAIGVLLTVLLSASAFGQSQAANGTIEGTVTDTSSGVLPGVTVTITNIETGAERSVTTNADGFYRVSIETRRYFDELSVVGNYETNHYRCDWGNG